MAKKKQERKKKSFLQVIGLDRIIGNETFDGLMGLVLMFIAGFVIYAMVSYMSIGEADQSILEHMRAGDWLNKGREFQNACGSWGAIISYWLMSVCFGFPAFLLPAFFFMVGLQMLGAYRINLWKYFFCMMLSMVWLSVTLAKFVTPMAGNLIFNPGGASGMFQVEQLERLVGAPGLTALLLIIAIAFLTYLGVETITLIRQLLNPIGYMSNKVKFIITNLQSKSADDAAVEPSYATADDDYDQPPLERGEDVITPEDVTPESSAAAAAEGTGADSFEDEHPQTEVIGDSDGDMAMQVTAAKEEDHADGETVAEAAPSNLPINPREPFTRYEFPKISLLDKHDSDNQPYIDEQEQLNNKNRIIRVLGNFDVQIRSISATVGPTITLYEIQPAEGVRISKIKNLEDDIALSLAASGIRIIAPIPGKGTIGIEVPNAKQNMVSMESIINSRKFQETKMELPIALGKTITNEVFMADLAKIPHLLVAGATGQGKSVGMNAIITSLLYKKHPNEMKLVLIDPKRVEFSVYAPIAAPFMASLDDDDDVIITDTSKVVRTLNSLCALMDKRFELFKRAGTRNIKEYNARFVNRKLDLSKGHAYMPYIVVIIDEFADLIMTAGKEVELPIARLAQLARAAGIHLVIATQRPSTTIITGNIKANFPGRISFKVNQSNDSKIILDRTGANQLNGRGDMLYLDGNSLVRVQCAFVDTPEVERINEFIAAQPGPIAPMELPEPPGDGDGGKDGAGFDSKTLDPLFDEIARYVVGDQVGSTSKIQRKFSIGFNRAGRLMDQLEATGIVGPAHGSKPREVLIHDFNQLDTMLSTLNGK